MHALWSRSIGADSGVVHLITLCLKYVIYTHISRSTEIDSQDEATGKTRHLLGVSSYIIRLPGRITISHSCGKH